MAVTEQISIGKRRRLMRLSDHHGRFKMLAIDQRGSLARMIAAARGVGESEVTEEEMRLVKRTVIDSIAPLATAVLTDPIYGYDACLDVIPGDRGVILALEVTGYEAGTEGERLSTLIDDWSVEKILRSGADAAKLLLWHNPDASEATHHHQRSVVRHVGETCARADLPFVLEVVTYPTGAPSRREFASIKPALVEDAARVFTEPEFGVDLMKLEFPADLKFVRENGEALYFGEDPLYDLATVRDACRRVDDACKVPWVILSAGVDVDEFAENVRLACEAGASGFLCGRAVWKEVVLDVPNAARMQARMQVEGRDRFTRFAAAAETARPWFEHPRFCRADELQSTIEDDPWYRRYGGLTDS